MKPEHLAIIEKRFAIVEAIGKVVEASTDKNITQLIVQLAQYHGINKGTYYRWKKSYDKHGLWGLRVKSFGSSRSKLTEEQTDIIIAMIYQNPMVRSTAVWNYLTHVYKQNPISGATVSRYMRSWKVSEHEFYTYLTNKDKWRGNYMLSFGDASKKAKHFCHYWEMDSTPADLMLDDGRWNLIGEIDIYTRKLKNCCQPHIQKPGRS